MSFLPTSELSAPHGFIQLYRKDHAAIQRELNAGLLAQEAFISPKHLYDDLGSKLFEAICQLPEYYLMRMEAAIMETHSRDIVRAIGRGSTMIDLGAGNCAKAAGLFPVLQPVQYVPVDISVDFLREAVERLRQRFSRIQMIGIGMDFSKTLDLPEVVRSNKRLFFYPGSSIGNFTPEQATGLLGRLRAACHLDGGVLIGVDLLKDRRIIEPAYDDALGVTAAFNLNLLRYLNNLLAANFHVHDWKHQVRFNEEKGCMDMYLAARRTVSVVWNEGRRVFLEGERIHTESSYKYTKQDFMRLLERAGFGEPRVWTDERATFMVCHAHASA